MDIRIVPYNKIDKIKWDFCIQNCENGLIYSTSAFLDAMSANWDAIIAGDYEAVMPLTWKRKFTVKYLYQPAFIQQNGIIGNNVDVSLTTAFLNLTFTAFSFAEFTLNYKNIINPEAVDILGMRNNYVLHLTPGAEKQLNEYVLKRVRRAEKNNLSYRISTDIDHAIDLYKNLYHNRLPSFTDEDFENFLKLCTTGSLNVIVRHIHGNRGSVVAVALLLQDKKRIYNIVSCITPEGKKLLANYFLYYKLIEEFSSTGLILDFEGSDIPGIAYFYKKFADANEQYPFVKINRLPAPLKLFKK